MLTRPEISDHDIVACLSEGFGVHVSDVAFLPGNVDLNCAVFRVTGSDGLAYFLKLRRWVADDTPLRVAAFLRGQGIGAVMAPIRTATGAVSAHACGYTWVLYSFFQGRTAMQSSMSMTQWIALGACMRRVHSTDLPADLAKRLPREDLAPRRRAVETFPRRLARRAGEDRVVAGMAALWTVHRDAIERVLGRAEQLADALRGRTLDLVLCHSDLHGNNVLVGGNDELAVVDWDEPLLAPKERDLMFVGGGIGGAWIRADEVKWFYEGYGAAFIDRALLAYYRYERIVADLVAYGERILGMEGSVADRAEGLRRLASAFLPGNVVEMADSSYPYQPPARSDSWTRRAPPL